MLRPVLVRPGLSLSSPAIRIALILGLLAAAGLLSQPVLAQPCEIPDNGDGTVNLPPEGCAYISPAEVHMIIDGLPPGTTIELDPIHSQFFTDPNGRIPGGSLGGEIEIFESNLELAVQGTGLLTGFNRTLNIPIGCETHVGPRSLGDPIQTFPNDMWSLQGQIVGDPDFALLRVTAGTAYGLPGPGETTLTQLPSGDFNVDSFFDITYKIEFTGATGSLLDGMSGTTTATLRMETGEEPPGPPPCVVPDDGSGTAELPPSGCAYVGPLDVHRMIDGLPPGTEIEVSAEHKQFFNAAATAGGTLGGEIETFDSFLEMTLTGTGSLAGFHRNLNVPMAAETHTGPRNPGDTVQTFDNDMFRLDGQIVGDPDFDLLRITGGTDNGLPGPGETTLTKLPSGNFNVDSFFDITYQIEFTGAPGGVLDGLAGTTTSTIRMETGLPLPGPPPCIEPDNGTGTVTLPPAGCGYVGPLEVHEMIDGLPPGTEIEISAEHKQFFNAAALAGGTLGGEIETFDSFLDMTLVGTGSLAGFSRNITLQVAAETHTGPRTPGDTVQTFPNDMFRLSGTLTGDPDFDLLEIRAGTEFGLPGPGQTTLTKLPSGDFNVDSFFDITYQIEFVGAPGSVLDGMSGTTTGTLRMQTGQALGSCPPIPAGDDIFPSTGKLVLESFFGPGSDPFVTRVSSAHLPDTVVRRGLHTGDTIPTEILQLDLQGWHPDTGALRVRQHSTLASLGAIENVVQDPVTCDFISGDSFFDVFVEVDVGAVGETWVNTVPARVKRKITTLPPKNDPYENPFVDPIVLYNQADGGLRGQMTYHLHHVDPPFPPPGPDCFPTDLEMDLTVPPLATTRVYASGPTTVLRTGPYDSGRCSVSGTPCTVDGDCILIAETCDPAQTIDTEIVEMDMTGSDALLGDFLVRLSPDLPSEGPTQSPYPDSTFPAESFFDVYVEVDLPGLGTSLHNVAPVPLTANDVGGLEDIDNIPPDPSSTYVSPAGLDIPLLDPTGVPMGTIRDVVHRLGPPEDWDPPPPADKYCFESWLVVKITIYSPFCEETLTLPGPSVVYRDDPFDPGDGRDEMASLLGAVLAEGTSSCTGDLILSLSPTTPAAGNIKSLAPAENFPADSFFDVYVEIESDTGNYYTSAPAHMTTTINSVPPEMGETYYGPGTVIPLYDHDSGLQIGEILEVEHIVRWRLEPCPPKVDIWFDVQDVTGPISFNMSIPGGGAGLTWDVVRGSGSFLQGSSGSMADVTCVQNDGPASFTDTILPPVGDAFYYVPRENFGGYVGSYNSAIPEQQGDRDPKINLAPGHCPPP